MMVDLAIVSYWNIGMGSAVVWVFLFYISYKCEIPLVEIESWYGMIVEYMWSYMIDVYEIWWCSCGICDYKIMHLVF